MECLSHSARSSSDPVVLRAIRMEDCNLAIWHRTAFADFAPLVGGEPQDLRFVGTPGGLADRLPRDLDAGALLCAIWPPPGPMPGVHAAAYEAFRDRVGVGRETGVALLGIDDHHWWERGTMHTLVYVENPVGPPLAMVCRLVRLWAWTPGSPASWNPRA